MHAYCESTTNSDMICLFEPIVNSKYSSCHHHHSEVAYRYLEHQLKQHCNTKAFCQATAVAIILQLKLSISYLSLEGWWTFNWNNSRACLSIHPMHCPECSHFSREVWMRLLSLCSNKHTMCNRTAIATADCASDLWAVRWIKRKARQAVSAQQTEPSEATCVTRVHVAGSYE